jgi:ABC-type sugar transport system ATPase subunit
MPIPRGNHAFAQRAAGLEPVTEGRILIGDVDVTRRPASERNESVGVTFDSEATIVLRR